MRWRGWSRWSRTGTNGLRSVIKALKPLTGRARIIGLTGAPGVGKSTVTGALVRAFRDRDLKMAVLAVDPTSPFSGGALLGDRVRMQEHATDPGVFIRSMGSRGQLGGLAAATPQAVRVLDAAGYQVIFVETVGVGQAEVEVASAADTTVVLVVPGMGDSVQAAKAGVLEVGGHVRGQQGRPAGHSGDGARPARDAPWLSRRRRLETADRDHGRHGWRGDRRAGGGSSTGTGRGWRTAASGTGGG